MIVVMLLAIGFGSSNNNIKVLISPFFASHQLSHLEELVTRIVVYSEVKGACSVVRGVTLW